MSMSTETEQIFEKLAAPFAADELKSLQKGNVTLSYITARTARRRLNEVLGPQNWSCRLEPAEHWVKCILTITLPDGKTVTREAMGGYPQMPSAEDKVKGGDSDAFKRACATFGIAEYLYGDDPVAHDVPASARPAPQASGFRAAPQPAPRPASPRPAAQERPYDTSRPPATGKALYKFCMDQEESCGFPEGRIRNLVNDHFGPKSDYGPEVPIMWRDWHPEHIRKAALFVMDFLSKRQEYNGEFDQHLARAGRDQARDGEGEEIPF